MKRLVSARWILVLAACLAAAPSGVAWCSSDTEDARDAEEGEKKKEGKGGRFKDPEDGKFDLTAGTDQGVDFNIELVGTVQQVKFRIGKSPVFLGTRYVYAGTDTVFTPGRGLRASLDVSRFAEALGGDFNYWSVLTNFRYYWRVAKSWILGFRGDYDVVGDGAPFYALSFVQLRGVPIFRYLGRYMVTVEVEPSYKIDERWSVLAFAGAGRAAQSFSNLSDADRAYGFGTGFRYLLARKLGLGAGIDLAQGPEDRVVYLTVGSAW